MPSYAYRAASASGRTVGGTEEAPSVAVVERALRARGLYPLNVSRAPPATAAPLPAIGRRRPAAIEGLRYLATLLEGGFPLERALGTVGEVVRHPAVRDAFTDVRSRLRSGATLADALRAHGRVFPPMAIAMVRAGERGGRLAEAIADVATQLERDEQLRAELVSALIYPVILCAVGGAAMGVLVLSVLPRFAEMLTDAGAALPWATALVLSLGAAVRDWWFVGAAGIVFVVAALAAARRSPAFRRTADGAVLRLPVAGALRRTVTAVRLGRALAPLLRSGLPILPALDAAADAVGSGAARDLVLRAREDVRAGHRLAPALSGGGILPHVFVQMIDLGERGGRLPEMLDRGAASAAADLERHLARLVRLVEPVLVVAFGAVVGFVALSLLQAISGVRLPP